MNLLLAILLVVSVISNAEKNQEIYCLRMSRAELARIKFALNNNLCLEQFKEKSE